VIAFVSKRTADVLRMVLAATMTGNPFGQYHGR
jgi:hypothetical protein